MAFGLQDWPTMNKNVSRKAALLRVQLSDSQLRQVAGGGDGGVTAPIDVEVESEAAARDAASGLASGKRVHKPVVFVP